MRKSGLIYFIVLVFSILVFNTCEEEFVPDIERYDEVLVIEGRITNESGPHKVRLTKSTEYNGVSERVVIGAEIKIVDDLNNEYPLREDELGNYFTDSSFSAKIGRSYKLYVNVEDNIFESTLQRVNEVQDVDSLYWRKHSKMKNDDGGVVEVNGIEVYLDSYAEGDDDKYFIWDYDETWEFKVQYELDGYEDKYVCWATAKSNDFHIGTTNDVVSSNIVKEPIIFITEAENRLAIKYSIIVNQYDIDKDVYDFYSLLNQQKDNVGTLFDKTPVSINGNISCTSNSEIPVMGIFQVSSVKSHRIFIDNNDLPADLSFNSDMNGCEMEVADATDKQRQMELEAIDMILVDSIAATANSTLYRYVTAHSCYDCTRSGFPNVPPDFWK